MAVAESRTATVPAAAARAAVMAAFAARTAVRRRIAVRVTRIMPVLYSPLTASTATIAITAWPR